MSKTAKKFKFTRSASVHAQDTHYERNTEEICMFVINGKGFLRFLSGFCVIINIFCFIHGKCIFWSQIEILEMKHNLQAKKTISSHLNPDCPLTLNFIESLAITISDQRKTSFNLQPSMCSTQWRN